MEKILMRREGIADVHRIEVYEEHGGYKGLVRALNELSPEELIEEIKKSGLRGRGGAGFPAGVKWGFVPKDSPKPKYLACNADEGEPGTFKDRWIMERDPHMLLEGVAIASYAIGAHQAFIYIRGEFMKSYRMLEKAIEEACEHNYLGKNIMGKGYDLDVILYRGAGAYICGEETGMLQSLEGKRGEPRLKPPFPAAVGLYQSPTVINNVETLSNLPDIVLKGAEWYTGIGTEKSSGTKLFPVSGHVEKPGLYELPMGTSLREIIYDHCGGVKGGKKLKAVIPGGSSTPMLRAEDIDVNMDFESLAEAGTMLGAGSVIVMDETTCIVWATLRLSKFYAHESCGQCTPCREGVPWMVKILQRIEDGEGKQEDIDLLLDICDNIFGMCLCPLGDAAVGPVQSSIQKFREEYEAHVREGRCVVKT